MVAHKKLLLSLFSLIVIPEYLYCMDLERIALLSIQLNPETSNNDQPEDWDAEFFQEEAQRRQSVADRQEAEKQSIIQALQQEAEIKTQAEIRRVKIRSMYFKRTSSGTLLFKSRGDRKAQNSFNENIQTSKAVAKELVALKKRLTWFQSSLRHIKKCKSLSTSNLNLKETAKELFEGIAFTDDSF